MILDEGAGLQPSVVFSTSASKPENCGSDAKTAAECSGGPSDTAPGPHLPHLKEGIVAPEAHVKFPGQQWIMNIMALVRPAHSSVLL